MQLLLSIIYTCFLFISTLLYSLVTLAVCWVPFLKRYWIARQWANVEMAALKLLCGLDYTVEGRENIPTGAHICMWKHSSAWETIAQGAIFPPLVWVLKRELTWFPVLGWAIRCMEPIAINRSAKMAAAKQVVAQGRERLARGRWVVIFPEGTRMAVGHTRKYGTSGALLAVETGALIIPVAHDAGKYWAKRSWIKKRGTIRVIIGPPIQTKGKDVRAVNEAVRLWIDTTVAGLGA
jgi:1-acyl-sn-glycerol-3-phosphate acyltransferase